MEYNKFDEYMHNYFSPDHGEFSYQLATAFALGMIFSPFSKGLFYLVLFIILFEIFLLWFCYNRNENYPPHKRILLVVIYIVGFIIGRIVIGSDKLTEMEYEEYYDNHRGRQRVNEYGNNYHDHNIEENKCSYHVSKESRDNVKDALDDIYEE